MQHSLCRFLTVDICALIASCYRVVFLVIVSSSIQGLCIWNSTRLVFSNWKSKCCPFPPETEKKKKGILTFLRISVHHWCFCTQLEAFLMETFTHPGNVPRPQDSAKPLMMIESTSTPCWKHAESLTLECAARLALGSEGGGPEKRGFEVVEGGRGVH